LFASVLFSDACKVEAHKRRRSTCRSKFSTVKKENYQITSSFSPSMAHEESHGTLPSEEETFRKSFYDITEMVKVLFEERNARLQGESSNPPKGNGDSGDKTPKGNGGNGDSPPLSPSSSTSSTIS
jgi:hypothetical protein